jgi:voltage-gated potassium channel
MFFGIGLLGYVLSLAASALIEQKSKESHGMSQFGFSNHLVICNFPSLGVILQILDELNADSTFDAARGVVLVDNKLTEIPQELVKRDVHFVRGDPSADDALERANVANAKHVIILSKSPSDPATDMVTVAIALAITTISPKADVVAQCVEPTHQALLRKAKCSHVVCLGQFGAHFVAAELLNPGAQDVVADLTSTLGGEQLYVSGYDGKPCSVEVIKKRCLLQRHLLIGIRRGPRLELNPSDEQLVNTKDHLVTIGATRLLPL